MTLIEAVSPVVFYWVILSDPLSEKWGNLFARVDPSMHATRGGHASRRMTVSTFEPARADPPQFFLPL